MKRLALVYFATAFSALGQNIPAPDPTAKPNATPPASTAAKDTSPPLGKPTLTKPSPPSPDLQAAVDRLSKTNQELLDLLDRQQKVLEDIQVDRRLQSRQVMLVEQRLEETLHLNSSLEAKISKLETQAASANERPSVAATPAPPAVVTNAPTADVKPAPPPPPASYLPAESSGGPPGTMWWHRVMSLAGDDMTTSKTFHIEGKQWRVVWHNQDRPGDAYKNTSALFVSAFPDKDTIPKRVCSKLGSGGDSTELTGAGDYYLKVEASGGRWELAIEDFR